METKNLRLRHLKRVTGEVRVEERLTLTPGMLFRQIKIEVVVRAENAERDPANGRRGGVPFHGFEFQCSLRYMAIGRQKLWSAQAFVEREEQH